MNPAAIAGALDAGAQVADGIFGYFNSRRQAAALRADARRREREGFAEEVTLRQEGRRQVGAGTAIAGASGFGVSGSALDVLADLAAEADVSARRARYQGLRDAAVLRTRAKSTLESGRQGLFTSLGAVGYLAASLDSGDGDAAE